MRKLSEKAKNEVIALTAAKANNDPLYDKYGKVRNAALRLRSTLIKKYSPKNTGK